MTTTTTTNAVITDPDAVARLRSALDRITEHPTSWFQGYWLRRTVDGWQGCLAGTLVLDAGYRPRVTTGWLNDLSELVELPAEQAQELGDVDRVMGVTCAHVAVVARYLLGTLPTEPLSVWSTRSRVARLFDSLNSLADLWRLASELTGGAIPAEPPAPVPA